MCTTELGYAAKLAPDFAARNTKLIGLSIDPVDNHAAWADDIEETQGSEVKFPMTADTDLNGIATPVNWRKGDDVIIPPTVSDEAANKLFPQGFKTIKPYRRYVKL